MLESIHSLVVPTDFSPLSDAALESAANLARPDGATIYLVHAVRLPLFHTPYDVNVPQSVWAELARNARERMYESQLQLEEAGIEEVSVIVSDTELPAEAIRRTALEHEADLVVMATHGRRGLKDALLGSVTERAIRISPIPVVGVRSQPLRVPPERLLVAVDHSVHSDCATELATAFATRFASRIDLIHVLDTLPDYLSYSSREAIDWDERSRAGSVQHLHDLARRLEAQGLTVDIHVAEGDTADEIASAADRLDTDLIVMGSRGLGGLERALLGSVTKRTLQRARCAVATVSSR